MNPRTRNGAIARGDGFCASYLETMDAYRYFGGKKGVPDLSGWTGEIVITTGAFIIQPNGES